MIRSMGIWCPNLPLSHSESNGDQVTVRLSYPLRRTEFRFEIAWHPTKKQFTADRGQRLILLPSDGFVLSFDNLPHLIISHFDLCFWLLENKTKRKANSKSQGTWTGGKIKIGFGNVSMTSFPIVPYLYPIYVVLFFCICMASVP